MELKKTEVRVDAGARLMGVYVSVDGVLYGLELEVSGDPDTDCRLMEVMMREGMRCVREQLWR